MTKPHNGENDVSEERMFLNLLCARQGDAWRIYAAPTWMPPYLRRCFDQNGEAYPAYLDFEDLERFTKKRGLEIEQRWTKAGDVELIARGAGARELAAWVGRAFSSGFREEGTLASTDKVPGKAS
jgi:hypothetical protein